MRRQRSSAETAFSRSDQGRERAANHNSWACVKQDDGPVRPRFFPPKMIMAGAPVTEFQSLLGHSSPAVTLKFYSYWFKNVATASVDRLAKSLPTGSKNLGHFGGCSEGEYRINTRFHCAERWPSGRRHQIANLAYWVTGTEGSNPSLSAKVIVAQWLCEPTLFAVRH